MTFILIIFFFKQKSAYEMRISDWSSDVCSSYLIFAKSNFSHCSASLLGSMKAAKSNLGNSPLKKGVLETAMVWAPLPSREWPRGLNVASHKIWRDRHIAFCMEAVKGIFVHCTINFCEEKIGRAQCRERVWQYG